jgi:hypothetical protein
MIVRQNDFAPGFWLIGARPRAVELTFDELSRTMLELAAAVAKSPAASGRPVQSP